MADFITRYLGVDASRLRLLGICDGHSLAATQTDKRFQSIATLRVGARSTLRASGISS